MVLRHRRALDCLCAILAVCLLLWVAPAWMDALIAATAACGWCYVLEHGRQEVTE